MITKIYLITNCYGDPNKVYIGKTKNFLKRTYKHKIHLGKQIIINCIDEVNSFNKDDWKPLECFWIEQFRQWNFDVINKNKGGSGSDFLSDETKQKISKSKTGQKYSKEHGLKISKALLGKSKPKGFGIGKIISLNTKEKMKNSHMGKIISLNTKEKMKKPHFSIRKPIYQYDLEGNFIKEWLGILEASKTLNKQGAAISECCNGLRKTAYKYIWKFK